METALTTGGLAPVVHGWTLTFHMFDYNLDHLGPGTIDDPAWAIRQRDFIVGGKLGITQDEYKAVERQFAPAGYPCARAEDQETPRAASQP